MSQLTDATEQCNIPVEAHQPRAYERWGVGKNCH